MRYQIFAAALAGLAVTSAGTARASNADTVNLTGDYVEARTASVFAGACHYNGELTTTGREAELVWHFRSGSSHGVSVSGLTAVAAVVADDNLKEEATPRRTVLYIDARATDAQMKVIVGALQTSGKNALGKIVVVKRAPMSFSRTGDSFHMSAKGVGSLTVDAMPNKECCKQPNLVWYRPLAEITDRKVGFTRESGVEDASQGISWQKSNQNTAFYGAFSIAP